MLVENVISCIMYLEYSYYDMNAMGPQVDLIYSRYLVISVFQLIEATLQFSYCKNTLPSSSYQPLHASLLIFHTVVDILDLTFYTFLNSARVFNQPLSCPVALSVFFSTYIYFSYLPCLTFIHFALSTFFLVSLFRSLLPCLILHFQIVLHLLFLT